ncbi:hypothetical protein BJ170DRAFT_458380 [Xylariales sp. AK1849]|nr:hypothetical protein BJ170DRAFT_458380 [Xylariales sp. AK1849]
MPVLPLTSLLTNALVVSRNTTTEFAVSSQGANATGDGLQVVCAWPVSGQYGPGSRALYYVLVAACLAARKTEWLKKACLAAALVFPAVAALHGIVLAALHADGAVDMDVYGAFQLCSIGILAAPVTVKLSSTYFNDRGRNLIFLWTGLILAGLLSLTVEFYRASTSDCTHDDAGKPINNARDFPYNGFKCNLPCDIDQPYSPMRTDSANNIYVIPAPSIVPFGTGTLLAAACCIPAILSLVSMWNKILEINWKKLFGRGDDSESSDEPIEGTNGATTGKMKIVNEDIKKYLKVAIEVPVFGGAILTILISGELNFFSPQVSYQTEPIASIGQWAPIVGTGLAALGSLYLLLAADLEAAEGEDESIHHCKCSHHHNLEHPTLRYSPRSSRDARRIRGDDYESPPRSVRDDDGKLRPTMSRVSRATDAGNRRKVATSLIKISNYLGNPARKRFDDSEFRRGRAQDFPEIPGEANRNRALSRIRRGYNQPRDAEGHISEQPSRTDLSVSNVAPDPDMESSLTMRSPDQSPTTPGRAGTLPVTRTSYEFPDHPSSPTVGAMWRTRQRRDTLEVPSPAHLSHTRNTLSSSSSTSTVTIHGRLRSPTIIISPEPMMSNPIDSSGPPSPPVRPTSTG